MAGMAVAAGRLTERCAGLIFIQTVEYRDMLDDVLLALADPTRRAILDRLVAGEARVTDVAAPFAMSLNAVSKHIQVLERAALIVRRRAGREHLLSRNPRGLEEAASWMAAEHLKWNNAFDRLAQALENDT